MEELNNSVNNNEEELLIDAQEQLNNIVPGSVNNNYVFSISNQNNVIEERFRILLNKPLVEFSNDFGEAYEVEDKKGKEDVYVFVYNSQYAQRLKNIKSLAEFKEEAAVIIPKKAEIVPIGEKNKYQLCVLLTRPKGISLFDYVQQNGPFAEAYVIEKLMLPILKAIIIYENLGLVHGGINPKNIYLDENNEIILGDAVRELCGFSQPSIYESIQRMLNSPFAKGEGDNSIDYFAFGVTLIYLLAGKELFAGVNQPDIVHSRLVEGSYYSYIKELEISNNIKSLFKGILCDRSNERWESRRIIEWHKGRKYNVPVLLLYKEAARSFAIGLQLQHFNTASLAFELWQDWHTAKKVLKDVKLLKWLETSLGLDNTAQHIDDATKMNGISFSTFAIDDEEFVARCLLTLDVETGFKYQNVCFSYEGLPNLFIHAFTKGKQDLLRILGKFISGAISTLFLEIKGTTIKSYEAALNPILEKCRGFYVHNIIGFGLERALYEFNPNLPCQSNLVIDYYCNNLNRLMLSLEKMADKIDLANLDKHLVGFIYYKLDLKKEPALHNISQYPEISENRIFKNLNILSMAQKASQVKKTPKLAKHFVESLKYVIDEVFKSKTFKENIKTKLNDVCPEGDLRIILDLLTDMTTVAKDKLGFKIATKRFLILEDLINKNNHSKSVFDIGYFYGLKIAMVFGYIVCAIVVLYSVSQNV